MTPDEVRLLDNKYALLFIRGERPIKDFKYDILKHKNVKYTTDGKEQPYSHGNTDNSVAILELEDDIRNFKETEVKDFKIKCNYELLSEEDIENYLGGKK